jgi:hypothetical protein
MWSWRTLRAITVAAALMVAVPSAVLASRPDIEHSRRVFTVQQDFCGLAVTADRTRVETTIFRDSGGNPGVYDTVSGTTRWTYEPTGRWVQNHFPGLFYDGSDPVSNGDGTVSFFSSSAGPSLMWTTSDGGAPILDTGHIVFVEVWDLHDPSTDEDDEFISSDILSDSGPSAVLDCDAIAAFLTS